MKGAMLHQRLALLEPYWVMLLNYVRPCLGLVCFKVLALNLRYIPLNLKNFSWQGAPFSAQVVFAYIPERFSRGPFSCYGVCFDHFEEIPVEGDAYVDFSCMIISSIWSAKQAEFAERLESGDKLGTPADLQCSEAF